MKTAAALTRSWPALAAWGGGLIDIALGAGAMRAGGAGSTMLGAALVGLGAAAFWWGAATLAKGRVVAPRAGVAGALASVLALALSVSVSGGRVSIIAATAGALLTVMAGVAAAVSVRRATREPRRSGAPARTGVLGLVLGAVAVAGLVTPALAATEAGLVAPAHSEHGSDNGSDMPDGGHGSH